MPRPPRSPEAAARPAGLSIFGPLFEDDLAPEGTASTACAAGRHGPRHRRTEAAVSLHAQLPSRGSVRRPRSGRSTLRRSSRAAPRSSRQQREFELLERDALAARLAVAVNLAHSVPRDLVAGEAACGVGLGLLLRRGVVVERRRVRAAGLATRRLCRLGGGRRWCSLAQRLRRHVQVVGARRGARAWERRPLAGSP